MTTPSGIDIEQIAAAMADPLVGPIVDHMLGRENLRELLREAIEVVHQTDSIRNHADPNDMTGWNVHGIETCADLLCVAALAALKEHP